MNKFILLINGPLCSGKSTVADLFLAKYPGVFSVSADKVKRLISDYSPEKYRGVVSQLTYQLAEQAVAHGFSLLVQGNLAIMAGQRQDYQLLAKSKGLDFFEINIEAPLAVLKTRFIERVAAAEKHKTKIFAKDMPGMIERYDRYMEYKRTDIPTFDSSLLSPRQLLLSIEKILLV